MKIYVSTNNYDFSQYPKELIVYCDGRFKETLALVEKNVIGIDDGVGIVKLI